jgi:hypothetical protein
MRPILVLFGAAVGVALAMLAIAAVIFPAPPAPPTASATVPGATGSAAPSGASTTTSPTGGPVIDPTTHVGGTLTVSGDRPGTFTLQGEDSTMSGYTLAGSGDRITFAQDDDGTLFVDHVTYDALDFYLDPGECEIEPGEVNTDLGISTVTVTCPEITDLRDTATVTVEGRVGVASTLTGRDDLPEMGGSVTVSGDVELSLDVEYGTWVQYPHQAGIFGGDRTNLYGRDGIPLVYLEAEEEAGPLAVVGFGEVDAWQEVEPGTCVAQTEQLAVASPDITYHALTLDCAAVPLVEGGTVSIEGSVVVERVPFRR